MTTSRLIPNGGPRKKRGLDWGPSLNHRHPEHGMIPFAAGIPTRAWMVACRVFLNRWNTALPRQTP
jgi:hypothetical protein